MLGQRGDRRIGGLRDDHVGIHPLPDEPLQGLPAFRVWLDRKDS